MIKTAIRSLDDWIYDSIGPIRVLFVVSNEFGFAAQQPILAAMRQAGGFRIGVTVESMTDFPTFTDAYLEDEFQKYFVELKKSSFMKWHYIMHSDTPLAYFHRNAAHIISSHGAAWGNTNPDWQVTMYNHPCTDMAFILSRNFEYFAEETMGAKFGDGAPLYFAVGAPKLDPMLNGVYDRNATLRELGLPADRKTILVTSHWTENSVLTKWGAQIVEELAPLAGEYNIIVTAHGNIWELPGTHEFNPSKLYSNLEYIADKSNFISFKKSGNVNKLLFSSDVLICDNSSVAVEFSTLDKPLVFYEGAGENMCSAQVRELYENASHCFSTLDGVREACREALANPAAKSDARRKMARYFIDNPGHASETVVRLIKSLGRLSGPRSRNWAHAITLSQEWKDTPDN